MSRSVKRSGRFFMGGIRLILLLGSLAAASVGCGTTSQPPPNLDLNPYTLAFSTDPAAPTAGVPVALKVGVTGKDPLSKRAEVSFDVKKVGADDRVEVPAGRKEEGQFEGKYTFKEAGRYSITVHVITRTVHQVANHEVEVK